MRRRCELLGLNRSSLDQQQAGETSEDLRLVPLIDERYSACAFYGSRRMTVRLAELGEGVDRKRLRRLMRVTGPEALIPSPG